MDGYLGEVKMFAGTFAPMNWQFCWGQLLSIANYSALFSILGNQFGGDGQTNFALPDLRGRVPVGAGAGTNLTQRQPGQSGGSEIVTLATAQMPQHSHVVKCDVASPPPQQASTPVNNLPGLISNGTGYAPGTGTTANMKVDMLSATGSSQPHENMPPWGCVNYIICAEGIWPPRD